jgi:hypothetical protein
MALGDEYPEAWDDFALGIYHRALGTDLRTFGAVNLFSGQVGFVCMARSGRAARIVFEDAYPNHAGSWLWLGQCGDDPSFTLPEPRW